MSVTSSLPEYAYCDECRKPNVFRHVPCKCDCARLRDITDPAAFWSSLTPAQVGALLDAAPKAAGPWLAEFRNAHDHVIRKRPDGSYLADAFDDGIWRVNDRNGMTVVQYGQATDLDSAKSAADAVLSADGWLLR